MKYIPLFLSLFLLISVAACRKELPQINPAEQYISTNLSQDFDAFWNGMNNNYLFWDIDPTNWDDVYRKYKPLFAQLKDEDEEKAYAYYQEMTAQLIDSHYALTPTDADQYSLISPASSRYSKKPGAHNYILPAHYQKTIPGNYLNPGFVLGFAQDPAQVLVAGKIKNTNILYFRFPEFALKEWYTTETGSAKAPIQYVLDELQKPGLDGLIIDVRGNSGGDVADLNFLMGRLIDKPYVMGATRAKAGMGRLDYLPWTAMSIYPWPGATAFTKPVVVLVDMLSVSMSEITAMSIRALPGGNGKIVGERTWGGTGPLSENIVYNGGRFSTSFFKKVETSSLMLRYKDGTIYEGVGVPPDVEAKYDGQALQNGKDPQLETAISRVR